MCIRDRYDTSGPYTDSESSLDIRRGLQPLRERWIADRNDTIDLDRATSLYRRGDVYKRQPYLLGIKAVIAESFERIHRSNLIGMGVLPLEYLDGADRSTYGLTGEEIFDITGIAAKLEPKMRLHVKATDARTGRTIEFPARLRIDTPNEAEYYRHGGILQYVLRQLRSGSREADSA